jgi:hypothetical protein
MALKHEVDTNDFFHVDLNGNYVPSGWMIPFCDINDGRCNYGWVFPVGDKFYWQRKPRAKDCFGCPRHKQSCLSLHRDKTPK